MGFSIGSHASKEKTVRYRFNLSHKVALNGDNPWLDAHKLVCLVLVLVTLQAIGAYLFYDHTLLAGMLPLACLFAWLTITTVELWHLHFRKKFWLTPATIPLLLLATTTLATWIRGPSASYWTFAAVFLLYMRTSVRVAAVIGGAAIVLSALALQSPIDPWNLAFIRVLTAGSVLLALLTIFFRVIDRTHLELAETLDALDNSLQSMSQGICVLTQDGRVKTFNDRMCELMHIPRSLLEGKPLFSEVVDAQTRLGHYAIDFAAVTEATTLLLSNIDTQTDEKNLWSHLIQDQIGRYIQVEIKRGIANEIVLTYADVTQFEENNRQLKLMFNEYMTLSEESKTRERENMIGALTELSVMRDSETGLHTKRTQLYVRALAEDLMKSSEYSEQLSPSQIDLIVMAAPMHDLGKVGIPDHILLKPGRFTDEERQLMNTHAMLGESLLEQMALTEKDHNSLFKVAAKLAGGHHENWDGSGYPRGLSGTDISIGARLMALADVYDALSTPRIYKKAWTHEDTCAHIVSLRGSKFDPVIVDAFLRQEAQFKTVAVVLADH